MPLRIHHSSWPVSDGFFKTFAEDFGSRTERLASVFILFVSIQAYLELWEILPPFDYQRVSEEAPEEILLPKRVCESWRVGERIVLRSFFDQGCRGKKLMILEEQFVEGAGNTGIELAHVCRAKAINVLFISEYPIAQKIETLLTCWGAESSSSACCGIPPRSTKNYNHQPKRHARKVDNAVWTVR